MGILANENAISSGGYQISNSLRFQSASSQYLSRTPASAGNRKTWTFSAWLKLGALTTDRAIFSGSSVGTGRFALYISSSGQLTTDIGGTGTYDQSTAVYRDPSAWYHLVWQFDTTQAIAADRSRMYINGVQVSLTQVRTYTQNADYNINTASLHTIGVLSNAVTTFVFDGHLTEVNFIDGQALTPSSFGETNTLTGQWVAKKYTGTYGTNGFYLPFSNGTSTTTLGYDSSGNGNNWTLTNFTRSAGVSDCWMYDVPSGNGGASGTQPSGNYCVLNPLDKVTTATLAAANLQTTSAAAQAAIGSIGISSGKYYWEISFSAATTVQQVGVYGTAASVATVTATTSTIGVRFDRDAGTLDYTTNGSSWTSIATGLTATTYFPYAVSTTNAKIIYANFGQRSFAYTPPSGFKALCTANLPASTIVKGNKYMDATLYTGNGSTQTITNAAGFKPDWFWIKKRNTATSHVLADSVRGNTKYLYSDLTAAEATVTDAITSFNSNGFSLSNNSAVNANADTYVGWQWQAGQGTTSSNTNGSITSTVSVSTTAGFSVVTYTGTGANATVGHGLGVAPKMIIIKNRTLGTSNWMVYHANANASPASGNLYLSATNAFTTAADAWNNTAPTSSVFSLGTSTWLNANTNNMVAYCFAEIAGFSKFGSYTGNGSADGPFVYCGFQPKFIMIKNTTTATTNWLTWDSITNSYNAANKYLIPNSSGAEQTTGADIDVLSNGFKVRNTSGSGNTSSATIIYAAFSSNPFQNSNAF